jgi:hypothetical protein
MPFKHPFTQSLSQSAKSFCQSVGGSGGYYFTPPESLVVARPQQVRTSYPPSPHVQNHLSKLPPLVTKAEACNLTSILPHILA